MWYIVNSIPDYRQYDKDGKTQEFINFFGKRYSNNWDNIEDLPDDQAFGNTKGDINGNYMNMLKGNSNKVCRKSFIQNESKLLW